MAVTVDALKATYPSNRINNKSAMNGLSWTPSNTNYIADSNNVQLIVKGFSVNVAGNVELVFMDQANTTGVVVTVVAGVIYPLAVKMIKSSSTTATGIVVYY